ncbi:REP-associated tyrosine transposase [Thauera butanivorans]|uniref:REP-associated tyrosine transposase n=1 Tax=Thauera butanivorans TaxID=86174 RepID=UPI003AB2FE91
MTDYRRARLAGGTFFFTVNLAIRKDNDLLVRHVDLLRHSIRAVQQQHPFDIVAAVILPEHLHMIWRLPREDADFSTRWRLVKGSFSRGLPKGEQCSPSRIAKGERGIWQRRYWEHRIRDDEDLRRHVEYIHYNPVKHGHVPRPIDWPYSSFHRYVRDGIYQANWAADDGIRRWEKG